MDGEIVNNISTWIFLFLSFFALLGIIWRGFSKLKNILDQLSPNVDNVGNNYKNKSLRTLVEETSEKLDSHINNNEIHCNKSSH